MKGQILGFSSFGGSNLVAMASRLNTFPEAATGSERSAVLTKDVRVLASAQTKAGEAAGYREAAVGELLTEEWGLC